jgi:probable non-F420 flavinoid oxidoreductase
MPVVGYHASHEQHPPSRLLDDARAAVAAGFGAVSCSDHFAPWIAAQGHSGHAWTWLGAAMASNSVPHGVVTAPGQRYHPAVTAQAIATLGELFPGRLWVALGSGEALNEHITGDPWPDKGARNERLRECVDVIRALLRGEEVSADGRIRVDRARLWTLPPTPPPLLGAALGEQTARWCGGWADGLVTLAREPHELRRLVEAFREGGGAGKPVRVQVKVSYARTDAEALAAAHDQWRGNVFPSAVMSGLETPAQYEAVAAFVRPEDLHACVMVSSDPGRFRDLLHELGAAGADELYLHQVGKEQARFIDTFGERVLPEFTGAQEPQPAPSAPPAARSSSGSPTGARARQPLT